MSEDEEETFSTSEEEETEENEDYGKLGARQIMLQQSKKSKKKSGGFQSMGLSLPVYKGVMKKGYRVPTPIQRKTIPLIMDGKDMVAMARTGSGKTAAFLIPLFEKLKTHSAQAGGVRGLILSPTRELALQTMKFTKELGRFTGLRAAVILGGDRMEDQFSTLHDNPDIIIATPGRFLHLLVEMELKLFHVEYIVFDEADRLFELGFSEQLHEIIHRLPSERQTLLFSATLPKLLVDFAKAGLSEPVLVRLDVESKLSDQLKTTFLNCRNDDKPAILLYLLQTIIPSRQQSVIFVPTKHHVEYIKELLAGASIDCSFVYSSLDQTARKISIGKFIHKKTNVLVVTDVAARGIDIPLLDNVINYNFPSKPKLFVHRVGRVARAGRSGTAYSLLSSDEVPYLVDLHLFLGRNIILPNNDSERQGEVEEDGVFGLLPPGILEDEEELILKLHQNDELTALQKVAENGLKHYIKSRGQSSPESVRRAKELLTALSLHPLFRTLSTSTELERSNLLESLKTYKPSQTIFEVNATAKGTSKSIMLSKRAKDDSFVNVTRERKSLFLTERDQTERGRKRGNESIEQSTGEDLKCFETLHEHTLKNKRKSSLNKSQPYINYRPSDDHTERGLSINHFEQQASSAVLDLTGDDASDIKKAKSIKKWDRKKKRFVTTESSAEGGKGAKRIKTESGQYIPSTYKSGLYKSWQAKNKMEGSIFGRQRDSSPTSFDDKNSRPGWKRSRMMGRASKGQQRDRPKSELKSVDEILRKRQKINFMKEQKQKHQMKKKGGSRGGRGSGTSFKGKGKPSNKFSSGGFKKGAKNGRGKTGPSTRGRKNKRS